MVKHVLGKDESQVRFLLRAPVLYFYKMNKEFIEFQEQVGKVKHLKRTGWVVRQVPNPETVAAHSWRMALMAIYKQKELKKIGADVNHVIEMCLLHDIGESVIGDIVPEIHQTGSKKISAETKKKTEKEAVCFLAQKYNFSELETIFNEYENQETLEAKVVKNLDKLDMLLQAYEYQVAYPDLTRLNEFMQFNEKDIDLPLFLGDIKEIKLRQFENKQNKNEFIDSLIAAGRLKHELYNPVKANIPDYDTVAAHLFRTALIAICFNKNYELIRTIISADKPKNDLDKRAVFELETLENILQAHEYAKCYPNDESLSVYKTLNSSVLGNFVELQDK